MIDNYAEFAAFYDEATTTDNPAKAALIESLITKYVSDAQELLEIGCGTGAILALLETKYRLTGLDLSQPMLDIAVKKVPSAMLVAGDMSTFELGKTYDVILCIFNSLNHLLEFTQWEQTFACVAKHLSPNGLFVFDVNTPEMFKVRKNQDPVLQYVHDYWVVSNMLQRGPNLYEWQIEIDDQPVVVPELSVPINQVEALASRYFTVKEKLTDDGSSVSKSTMRVYFACQKE